MTGCRKQQIAIPSVTVATVLALQLCGLNEAKYTNTVLYPVSEDARQSAHNGNDQQQPPLFKPGAPSRYLEYEGPDATYHIRLGTHPTISYPNLEDFDDTEIRIRYEYNRFLASRNNKNKQQQQPQQQPQGRQKGVLQVDDCPRHFLWLSDRAVQSELDHRLANGRWSERVLVEKAYFTLFYGGTGLASQYMDSVDDFQTDLEGWEIMNRSSNHCEWEGISCGSFRNKTVVTSFQINGFSLEGSLPKDMYQLSRLEVLDLQGNKIQGKIPPTWGNLRELRTIDLRDNRLSGSLPESLTNWGYNIRSILFGENLLEGTIPSELIKAWTGATIPSHKKQNSDRLTNSTLETLDLSKNQFVGTFPFGMLLQHASELQVLDLAHNQLEGSLPNYLVLDSTFIEETLAAHDHPIETLVQDCHATNTTTTTTTATTWDASAASQRCIFQGLVKCCKVTENGELVYAGIGKLQELNLSHNSLGGSLPTEWMKLPSIKVWNLSHNSLEGSLPKDVWKATTLEQLKLSYNQLTGTIPNEESTKDGENDNDDSSTVNWSNLVHLQNLNLDHNFLKGTIPPEFLKGLSHRLENLDLGANSLSGSIPTTLGKMTRLDGLDVHGNQLTGKLPVEMNRMHPDVRLNLTDNLLTGTVPKIFCGGGEMSSNLLFRQFGCDAVLCPPGTFHPNGAASLYSGCRSCPTEDGDDPLSSRKLGVTRCGNEEDNFNRMTFVHGDLNGDGELSEREVLRLLYTYTLGKNWGLQFENWGELVVDKCDLNGVTCAGGKVTRIDLTDAAMCVTADRKMAPPHECKGIPAEISKLSHLEVLTINRRQYLRGTLPTEIGELKELKYLDISSCPMMTGQLPSELGLLTNLKYLNIGGCRFNGTIPEELFELSTMEKLHLSMNAFTGTVSSSLAKMTDLKELLLSRTYVNGTIPEAIGELVSLENFEMYGNQLVGTIPSTLGRCTNLKRIDLFNNKLTGTIPDSLTRIKALQILHIKLNHLTGTISSGFGKLPYLSWFDVSTNHLHGTIPESFGYSKTLKDFRLGGGNMIHNPVPKSLCSNTNINGGLPKMYGCSGVICPLGTYSDPGHATHSEGCKRCPHGRTTIYLGSSRCVDLADEDILAMFYDAVTATNTFPLQQNHWEADSNSELCTWTGVECDENENIESLWFPLLGLNADTDWKRIQ